MTTLPILLTVRAESVPAHEQPPLFRRAPHTPRARRTALALALLAALAGCAVGPRYERPPTVDTPAAFKEGAGQWLPAAPADTLERGPWWQLFGDPALDALAARVDVSNQNVAAAVAVYRQARTLVAQQRAWLLPTVMLDAGARRSGGEAGGRGSYQVDIGGSWEPDVWGRLTRGVEGARAGEQASAADLAAARLSAQGELAIAYTGLRALDAQRALLAQTIAGYQRSLQIASNRYRAGISARTDSLQAQTQLANAQAEQLGLERQRAQFEHAIAVLVGQAPAHFSLPAQARWQPVVPPVPIDLPSTLLQRRPDIATAERRVARANEQIGIAQSAYYPSLRLSGSAGLGAASVGELFSASSLVWALGVSAAQTVFDAGATRARVEGAGAAFDQAVARYRQTVLEAFGDVENRLVAARILGQQLAFREQAAQAAELAEQQVLNRYQAGQVGYAEVIAAQASAQNARRSLVQLQSDRQVAAVALIQALGGGWRGL